VHPPDNESFGASQILDPWGELLARAPDSESIGRPNDDRAARLPQECFVAADLDLARQDAVRESLPSLANRVPAAYSWPQEVRA
jgi:predicted amidohydrolase